MIDGMTKGAVNRAGALLRDHAVGKDVEPQVVADAVVRQRDYIEYPKATGYRAIHVIVRRHDSLVEVQLRTELQHRWALSVERAESVTGMLLKDGVGDKRTLAGHRVLGEALAHQDRGDEVPPELVAQLSRWLGTGQAG